MEALLTILMVLLAASLERVDAKLDEALELLRKP